jgi:hypothetical protein
VSGYALACMVLLKDSQCSPVHDGCGIFYFSQCLGFIHPSNFWKEIMQCPFCASELKPDAVSCENCGAVKVNERTTVGVFAGWVGMVIGLIWIMLWVPLPFIGYNMSEYPWITLVVGTIVALGLLWYSRSTLHSRWIRRDD